MFHTCFTVKQMSHIGCTYVTGHMCLTYVAAFSIHVFLWHLCVDFGVRLYHIWIRFCLHGAFLNLLTVFPIKTSDFWPEPAGAHVAWFRRIPGKCIGWNLLLFVSILFLIALLMTTRGWPVFSTTQIWVLPTKNIRLPSIAMGSEGPGRPTVEGFSHIYTTEDCWEAAMKTSRFFFQIYIHMTWLQYQLPAKNIY